MSRRLIKTGTEPDRRRTGNEPAMPGVQKGSRIRAPKIMRR
jgi:hypothetical protein